jgi:hypothetical protein
MFGRNARAILIKVITKQFSCKNKDQQGKTECQQFCEKPENKDKEACTGPIDCTASDKKYSSTCLPQTY